jgi:hypothetical protein
MEETLPQGVAEEEKNRKVNAALHRALFECEHAQALLYDPFNGSYGVS